jgi:hypothetical protein
VSDSLSTPPNSGLSLDPGPRGRLVQLVAAAVDAVGGVRRSAGDGVGIVTQYPGGAVTGVRLADGEVTVCIVVEDIRVKVAADVVRASVGRTLRVAGEQRRVNVIVADIDLDVIVEGASCPD